MTVKNLCSALGISVIAALSSYYPANADMFPTPTQAKRSEKAIIPKPTVDLFAGTYLGYSPSYDSPVLLGELEIIISKGSVTGRFANGIGIISLNFSNDDGGMRYVGKDKKPVYGQSVYEFRNINGVKCTFTPNENKEGYSLRVKGRMSDALGQTLLFGPREIERGEYAKFIQDTEKKGPYPQLKYGGKVALKGLQR